MKQRSIKAAIAEIEEDDFYSLSLPHLTLRTLLGIILLIPCYISTIAIFEVGTIAQEGYFYGLISSRAFLFFGVGVFLMIGWLSLKLFRSFFLCFYVLGHELTHALFVLVCGGKVSKIVFSSQGGYIVTNKSNFLIALSPYFVPFWTVLLVGISELLRAFYTIPYHDEALYLLMGASWSFHLIWTIWMIPKDQPDLKENGSFFSLTIIYLANVLLLALLLCLAPHSLSFKSYCYHWINLLLEHIALISSWLS